jgi:hypothetical protein
MTVDAPEEDEEELTDMASRRKAVQMEEASHILENAGLFLDSGRRIALQGLSSSAGEMQRRIAGTQCKRDPQQI